MLISLMMEKIQTYISDKISDIEHLVSNCNNVRGIITDNINLDKAANLTSTLNFDVNFFQNNVNEEIDATQSTINGNFEELYAAQCFFNKCIRSIEKKSKTTEFVKIHTTEKSPLCLITTQKRTTFLDSALKKVDFCKYPDLKKLVNGITYKKGPSSNKQIQSPKLFEIYKHYFWKYRKNERVA